MQSIQSRRDFLAGMSEPAPLAFSGPGDRSPTRGRRKRPRSDCPTILQYVSHQLDVADNLLRAEGFTEIRYVPTFTASASGE